jgi:hypothetical protein
MQMDGALSGGLETRSVHTVADHTVDALIALPREALSNAEYASLMSAYRMFEANPSDANAASVVAAGKQALDSMDIAQLEQSGVLTQSQSRALAEVKAEIENIDSGNGVGDNGDRASITKKYKATSELLSESTCSNNDLYSYLKSIDSVAANIFFKSGNWPEGVQIPKSHEVLNPDGTINWDEAREGGYVLDSKGNAIKEQYTPFVGEVIDRFGPPNGRYVCPVKDGKPYSYNKRSLPFVEDAMQYHQYKIKDDLSKIEEYVESCTDIVLRINIQDYIDYWCNGDYKKAITYMGVIAEVEAFGKGGGVQYELPIPIEWLIQLKLLEEIY